MSVEAVIFITTANLIKKTFAKNLRTNRKKNGFNIMDISSKTGIKPATLAAYEGGHICPSILNLIKISAFFQATLEELLGLDLPPPIGSGSYKEGFKDCMRLWYFMYYITDRAMKN